MNETANETTNLPKNYRPTACLNITYKFCSIMLNQFSSDHYIINNITTTEQAGGKKRVWGCADQLIINKMILYVVQHHRRKLLMMWFYYKKAFDFVPHDWIIRALHLAKIPQKIIDVIQNLMKL